MPSDKKSCKKSCYEVIYYSDITQNQLSDPVPDVYQTIGGNSSFSIFGSVNVYSDPELTNRVAILETNTKYLYNYTTNPPLTPKSVVDATGIFLDGETSLSLKFYFNLTGLESTRPLPGQYKTVAYSSTGMFYKKKVYCTLIIPEVGTVWMYKLKVHNE